MKGLLTTIFILGSTLYLSAQSAKEANRLFLEKCVSCHRPTGNAPFDLTTYKQIDRFRTMIQHVVQEDIMPPWRPDNHYNQYKHNRGLNKSEKEQILNWVKNLKKKDKLLPWEDLYPLTDKKEDKQFIDLKHPTGLSIAVYPKDTILVFEFPYSIEDKKNITQIEFYCSNMKIIHHANYFVIDAAKAKGKKATIMNENFLSSNDIALGYAPGNQQLPFEEGNGFILPKSGKVVGDIHISPNFKTDTLQFGLRLHYTDKPLEQILFMQTVPNLQKVNYTNLEILPNEIRTFKAYYELSEDIKVLYTHPHMHVFGKKFLSYAVSPNNDTIPIIKINEWKFYEQEYYEFEQPIYLKKGTKIYYEATYDNTTANLANPFSPPILITEGWSINQEMLINLLICTFPKEE